MGVWEEAPYRRVLQELDLAGDRGVRRSGGQHERCVEERARPHLARRGILREDQADLRAIGCGLAVRRVMELQLDDAPCLETQRRSRTEHLRIRAGRVRADQAR